MWVVQYKTYDNDHNEITKMQILSDNTYIQPWLIKDMEKYTPEERLISNVSGIVGQTREDFEETFGRPPLNDEEVVWVVRFESCEGPTLCEVYSIYDNDNKVDFSLNKIVGIYKFDATNNLIENYTEI